MSDKPILFSGEMVRALLDGRKTQTRRIVKLLPQKHDGSNGYMFEDHDGKVWRMHCPYGQHGDLLWARETFVLENTHEYHGDHKLPTDGRPVQHNDHPEWAHSLIPHYRATEPEPHIVSEEQDADDDKTRWTPSIYMKRWASRLTLEITDVRVERLQDISEVDAKAEGVMSEALSDDQIECGPQGLFEILWRQINGHPAWDSNPWVWVLTFKVHRVNVDEFLKYAIRNTVA